MTVSNHWCSRCILTLYNMSQRFMWMTKGSTRYKCVVNIPEALNNKLRKDMEHQPTPSPSSLASILNPVHSPPPTHHQHILQQQQQQQQNQNQNQVPFKKKTLSDPARFLSHKRSKLFSSAEQPPPNLLFIDSNQHKPAMATMVENHLKHTDQNEINHSFKQLNSHPNTTNTLPSLNSASPSTSLTIESSLEESIFGIAPFNDFTWTIAQFIWEHSREYWERGEGHLVEVEAKLGTIRDKRNQFERMEYPIATESPILETRDTKFESDMHPSHHAILNRLLNQRVTETNTSGYLGAKVDYVHLKEVDEFHQNKVRVSRDWSGKTNHPPRSIIKEKLAHLDIHCPGRPFDFRISINVEHPDLYYIVPIPPEHSIPTYKRIKDRLSYSHQICQIDLTQVKSSDQLFVYKQNNSTSTHEVEVEFKDSIQLLRAASIWASEQQTGSQNGYPPNGEHGDESVTYEEGHPRSASRKPNRNQQQQLEAQEYLLMVEVMLNNVRMLIRNC
ncbi:hypothetical protein VP01_444g1 [Puccinia sorghi]|uniref:mRNA-capping enzyme subunit beta n=1 Tax=Puccinia sorghi TaxID=27349 RepID=A0A0L6UPE3_9BASI|nr:hypothetical protein VP01_444g1 [Puccinia sorghi]